VQDLVQHSQSVSYTTAWSLKAVFRLASPYFSTNPADWPLESKRIELLESLPPPVFGHEEIELKNFYEQSLVIYNERYRVPLANCLRYEDPSIHLDEIHPLISPLLRCQSPDGWEAVKGGKALSRLIDALKGRTAIDGRGASPEACAAWSVFEPLWQSYIYERPSLQRILDPYWVIINIFGVIPPPGLAAAIASYPVPGSNAPPLLPGLLGNPYIIPFATAADARRFIGYIQSSCEGLNAFLTGNVIPPVLY
jgi:hypothetical protein